MYTVDLHNHTKFSYDGSNTPEEIIENAIGHGVDVIGITDHQFSIGENLPIYYEYIQHCKQEICRSNKKFFAVLKSVHVRHRRNRFRVQRKFLIMYFECLDDKGNRFYEFWNGESCLNAKQVLHIPIFFKLGERYGLDIIKILRDNDIFLGTRYFEITYYDFLTNEKKQQIIKESGIPVSVGSDTRTLRNIVKQIRRANKLLQKLNIPLP